jgi:hypothetical protein
LELAFDSLKQVSYERFSRICATVRMTRWIGTKVRRHLVYDDTIDLYKFFHYMEEVMGEDRIISILDIAFQNTLARWWAMHKASLRTWDEVEQDIHYRFGHNEQLELETQTNLQVVQPFSGESNPRIHIQQCVT